MAYQNMGFIGAGKMATALALGLIKQKLIAPERLWASDPYEPQRQQFHDATGGRVTDDNCKVASESQVLFLAVKPQHVVEVCRNLRPALRPENLVISIAAGVSVSTLVSSLGRAPRIVRVMPNTPALVGEGAAGFCLGPNTHAGDGPFVQQLLECVGKAFEVPEYLLDAVTGLSGSGPAFVFAMIEALSDAGVHCGLPREISTTLAAQTLRGAAEMVLTTKLHPAVLKDQVTSPGGTTIAGLYALEKGGMRAALMSAVEAATRRAQELDQAAQGS